MELSSSDKERIQHQYDALAKKTLVGEAKSHRRTLAKRAAREVTFSDLSESELAQLFTTDEYESDYFRFQVSGFDVLVKNELLDCFDTEIDTHVTFPSHPLRILSHLQIRYD